MALSSLSNDKIAKKKWWRARSSAHALSLWASPRLKKQRRAGGRCKVDRRYIYSRGTGRTTSAMRRWIAWLPLSCQCTWICEIRPRSTSSCGKTLTIWSAANLSRSTICTTHTGLTIRCWRLSLPWSALRSLRSSGRRCTLNGLQKNRSKQRMCTAASSSS